MPRRRKLHQERWSSVMSNFLLTHLVGEIKAGHKGSNGFKAIALNNAAEAVSKKFGKTMTSCHVQNHLKTLKKYWSAIERIKKNSGVVFNSDTNTLQMGLEEYMKYIEVLLW
jgi:Myb/SANT-like DNA-binding domain